jgi:mannose-6-phosphate isomerase
MTELYPLSFKPILKDKIWGGNKIREFLDKDFSPLPNCGESWEVSGVEGNISEVKEGPLAGKNLQELIETYKEKLVGNRVYQQFGETFPLLIKFIDANDDLSIQVHPDDKLGMERHQSFGKTEMWYVVQSDPDSTIITGFNQEMSRQKYLDHFKDKKLMQILNQEQSQPGDVFFIPAGRVHTLGKGNLIAEIQQTSDITYRIYDFDRVDSSGKSRELHVEEALDAIDYQFYQEYKSTYQKLKNESNLLVSCPYFETNLLDLNEPLSRDYSEIDSFRILICLEGKFSLEYSEKIITGGLGETFLIPAELDHLTIKPAPAAKLLETFIPNAR